MSRFSEVTYDAKKQTVVVGAGLVWDDVYAALAPHGVTVVGARVSGVGVAGFALGGGQYPSLVWRLYLFANIMCLCAGYSWKTNQYGLTLDTIVAYELVKTNGQVVQVTAQSDPDLFFALRVRLLFESCLACADFDYPEGRNEQLCEWNSRPLDFPRR